MATLQPVEAQRALCESIRAALRDVTAIHVKIDTPRRRIGADEPDWVFRLRKVCLHVLAITKCCVDADGVHAMTTELRAAYEQMDAVWRCLPDAFRLNEHRGWWSAEADDGLAAYSHPTPVSLALPLFSGGFDDAEAPESYLRLAIWLGSLGCAYGLALGHLARQLGSSPEGIDARLVTVMERCAGVAQAHSHS